MSGISSVSTQDFSNLIQFINTHSAVKEDNYKVDEVASITFRMVQDNDPRFQVQITFFSTKPITYLIENCERLTSILNSRFDEKQISELSIFESDSKLISISTYNYDHKSIYAIIDNLSKLVNRSLQSYIEKSKYNSLVCELLRQVDINVVNESYFQKRKRPTPTSTSTDIQTPISKVSKSGKVNNTTMIQQPSGTQKKDVVLNSGKVKNNQRRQKSSAIEYATLINFAPKAADYYSSSNKGQVSKEKQTINVNQIMNRLKQNYNRKASFDVFQDFNKFIQNPELTLNQLNKETGMSLTQQDFDKIRNATQAQKQSTMQQIKTKYLSRKSFNQPPIRNEFEQFINNPNLDYNTFKKKTGGSVLDFYILRGGNNDLRALKKAMNEAICTSKDRIQALKIEGVTDTELQNYFNTLNEEKIKFSKKLSNEEKQNSENIWNAIINLGYESKLYGKTRNFVQSLARKAGGLVDKITLSRTDLKERFTTYRKKAQEVLEKMAIDATTMTEKVADKQQEILQNISNSVDGIKEYTKKVIENIQDVRENYTTNVTRIVTNNPTGILADEYQETLGFGLLPAKLSISFNGIESEVPVNDVFYEQYNYDEPLDDIARQTYIRSLMKEAGEEDSTQLILKIQKLYGDRFNRRRNELKELLEKNVSRLKNSVIQSSSLKTTKHLINRYITVNEDERIDNLMEDLNISPTKVHEDTDYVKSITEPDYFIDLLEQSKTSNQKKSQIVGKAKQRTKQTVKSIIQKVKSNFVETCKTSYQREKQEERERKELTDKVKQISRSEDVTYNPISGSQMSTTQYQNLQKYNQINPFSIAVSDLVSGIVDDVSKMEGIGGN